MKKMEPELKNLSLMGRLCYLFMCIEKYLTQCYPERDWSIVAKRCWQLTNLFVGLTTGNSEDEINQVLKLPMEFNNACEDSEFYSADIPTLKILYKMKHFLSLHNISFPSLDSVQNMTVDQENGWGNFIDSEYLSVILQP